MNKISFLAGASIIASSMAVADTSVSLNLGIGESDSATSVVYTCQAHGNMMVRYVNVGDNALALMNTHGKDRIFVNVVAGSGAQFVSGSYVWWSKGNTATLEDTLGHTGIKSCTTLPENQTVTPALAGEAWHVEDINGAGVIDNSNANLLFMDDGSLAGSATCNRLLGNYETTDSALSIGPTGATMMVCPPALENQERALLAILEAVTSYTIDETGALVLLTNDGATLTARPR